MTCRRISDCRAVIQKAATLIHAFLLCTLFVACAGMPQQAPVAGRNWEAAIAKFEEADQKNPPPKGAVLFVGSSSIAAWKNLSESFPSIKVINRGFGGSEIADSTYYLDRIVTPYQPRGIVLYAGDNDLFYGKTPQQVANDYQEFVTRCRAKLPQTWIAFVSIKPSGARWHLIERIRAANDLIRNYTSQVRGLIYLDIFTPMLGTDGMPRQELFVSDKLHMSAEGYLLWSAVIAPYVSQ